MNKRVSVDIGSGLIPALRPIAQIFSNSSDSVQSK